MGALPYRRFMNVELRRQKAYATHQFRAAMMLGRRIDFRRQFPSRQSRAGNGPSPLAAARRLARLPPRRTPPQLEWVSVVVVLTGAGVVVSSVVVVLVTGAGVVVAAVVVVVLFAGSVLSFTVVQADNRIREAARHSKTRCFIGTIVVRVVTLRREITPSRDRIQWGVTRTALETPASFLRRPATLTAPASHDCMCCSIASPGPECSAGPTLRQSSTFMAPTAGPSFGYWNSSNVSCPPWANLANLGRWRRRLAVTSPLHRLLPGAILNNERKDTDSESHIGKFP
jgi:hypothetical protein